jgi:phosphoglycerate dehydrogenase-like enzyme
VLGIDLVTVYLSYPPDPDVGRLRQALGDDADRVELIAGPLYMDVTAVRTAKRARALTDELLAQEPELTEEHRDAYAAADVVVGLDVPARILDLAPRLGWIQACGAGVGQFDEEGLAARGVALTTAAGVSAAPIAEFVIGRVLEVYKGFGTFAQLQREHRWEFTPGRMLQGRTVLIVGLGAIGRAVAQRARALGMGTLGIRRSHTPGAVDPDVDELHGPADLDDLLGRADVVVLAAPESSETHHLLDAGRFAAMRDGAVLCNVARGSLVDEDALVAAVRSGKVEAAILDVATQEPLPADSPLWDVEGVLLSPHSSASQEGYDDRLLDLFAANLRRFLHGEALANQVDLTLVGG